MRTKSRARVAADRAKGQRSRGGKFKLVSARFPSASPVWQRQSMPVSYRTNIQAPGGSIGAAGSPVIIGDDMRRKFALRGQRDLELSQAYTEAQVNAIMARYGSL